MCKFSLRTYILPPSSLNILIISVLYSVSGRLLPFCLLLFVEFFPVISFGECCWSPPFGRVPVFFSMCEVDLKSLPVLSGWGYVVGVLWGTVVQCPLSSEPGASGLCSVWVV